MTDQDPLPDVRARTAPRVRQQDPPPSVFDRVLDEEERQQSLRLRQNFSLATQAEPDVAGEAQSLGARLGVDSLVGERNIGDLRQMSEESKLADLSPSLRRQLLDQEFARIAHDDLDNLSLLEDLASKVWETPGEFLSMARVYTGQGDKADTRRVITSLGRFLQEKTTVEKGVLGTGVIFGGFTEQAREAMERLDRRRAKLPHSSPGLISGLAGMLGQLSQTMPIIAGTAGAAGLVGTFTGPGALVLAGAGGTAAIFTTSAMIEGGNQTLDLIAAGVDPGLARVIGATVGGINGYLETVGFRFLSAATRKLIREVLTKGAVDGLRRMTVRRAATRAAGAYGLALAGEEGTELAQEVVNMVGEVAGGVGPEDMGEVFERLGSIVAETFAGVGILALIGPVAQFSVDTTRANDAQQAQVLFEELSNGVQDSKVRGRNQRAFAQFLQSGLDGTPGENIYIRPEKLQEALQSVGIERVRLVEELPDVQQQLESALDSGADVVIPTADYQALVAGTPLDQALRPHLRLDPEAVSLEEAQVFFQTQDESRENAERIVQETVARTEAIERQADKVESDILGQLTETGLFRRKQAQALATVHRAVVMNLAAREGITVEEFQRRRPLRVRRGRKQDVLGPRFEQREEGDLIREEPTQPPAREQLVQEGGVLGIEGERREVERRVEDVGAPEGVADRRVAPAERRAPPSALEQMAQEGGELGIESLMERTEGETVAEFTERQQGARGFRSAQEAADARAQQRLEGEDLLFQSEPLLPFQEPAPLAPPEFFSALKREIEGIGVKERGLSVPDWKGRIRSLQNKGKVKKTEVEQTGILEWLDLQEGRVTKEKVEGFLDENGFKVFSVSQQDANPQNAREIARVRIEQQRVTTLIQQAPSEALGPLRDYQDSLRRTIEGLIGQRAGPQFQGYSLPGGENYRTIVISAPNPERTRRQTEALQIVAAFSDSAAAEELGGGSPGAAVLRTTFEGLQQRFGITYSDAQLILRGHDPELGQAHRGGHFSQLTEVVAHLRLQDFTDSDGRRVLNLIEVQSDWSKAGKRTGFLQKGQLRAAEEAEKKATKASKDFVREELSVRYGRINTDDSPSFALTSLLAMAEGIDTTTPEGIQWWNDQQRINSLIDQEREAVVAMQRLSVVPGGPFVRSTEAYVTLAMKQLLMEAVAGGYDRISLIRGDQNARFYSLRSLVTEMKVRPGLLGDQEITTVTMSTRRSGQIAMTVDSGGRVVETNRDELRGKHLDEIVHKELGEQILQMAEKQRMARAGYSVVLDTTTVVVGRHGPQRMWNVLLPDGELHSAHGGPIGYVTDQAASNAIDELVVEDLEDRISGEDLRVGGLGMLRFYGPARAKDLPAALKSKTPPIVPKVLLKLSRDLGGPREFIDIDLTLDVDAMLEKDGVGPNAPLRMTQEAAEDQGFTFQEDSFERFDVLDVDGELIESFTEESEADDRAEELNTERRDEMLEELGSAGFEQHTQASVTEGGEDVEGFQVTNAAGEPEDFFEDEDEAQNAVDELNEAAQEEALDDFESEFTVGQIDAESGESSVTFFDRPIEEADDLEDALETIETLLRDPEFSPSVQPALSITPELRDAVQQGLPLLQQGPQGPRGAFDPSELLVTLFEKADVSSGLHEFSHYYLTVLAQIASSQTGPTQIRADVEAFLKMVGVDSLDQFVGMTLNQQRKAHETFALSFEDYMHSGKAPSADLERVFERFRRWLRQIYKAVRDRLNAIFRREFNEDLPILTPEFRAIFDRMLASDEAIEHAEAIRSYAPHFQTQEEAGATDDKWSGYVQTLSDSHEGAVTKLLKAMLGDMQWLSGARSRVEKERQAEHDELREEIRKDEAEVVRRMPVYRAIHFLRRGEFITELGEVEPGPDNSRLNTEAARSMLPKGATLRDISGMTNKVGLPPDIVAKTFGFGSGQDMIAEIVSAVPEAELVTERTDDRMLAENGDMLDAEAVEEAIQSALHNEAHGRAVATEWKFLSGATQPVRLIRAAARRSARDALSKMPVNKIRHRTFVAAEARARREAMDASRRQEPALAIRKKREELLQREMAAESLNVQEEIRKVLNLRTNRLQGPLRRVNAADEKLVKTRDIDLVRAARSVLASVGLFPRPETAQEKQLTRESLEVVREQHPGIFNGVLAIKEDLGGTDLREATLEEFRDVIDVVQSLWELSVNTKTFEIAGRKIKQAEARELLTEQLTKLPELKGFPVLGGRKVPQGKSPSFAARKIQLYWQTLPALKRFQHYALFLDDGKLDGAFQTIVQRPMFDAVNRMLGAKLELMQPLRDQMKKVRKNAGPWFDQEIQSKRDELPHPDNPRIGFVFRGKRELLDVMLDMGNPSNLTKRLVGEGWARNPNETDGVLDTTGWDRFIKRMWDDGVINQTDLDFVQLVGALFEDLRPLSQATQREVFGVEFEELELGLVTLPSGEQVKGWYAPLRPDRLRAKLPQTRTFQDLESLEGLEQEYQYSAQPIGPGRGFTISRNPNYFDRLSMDIGRRLGAFDEELRFIFLMPHTKAMVRLFVHDREMGQAMTDYDPEAVRGIILPWLRTTSRQVVSEPGNNPAIDAAFRIWRAGTGVAYLGWNLGTALIQESGFVSSLTQVKPKYLLAGLNKFRQGPLSAWKEAMTDNPRMRERLDQHGQRMWDYLSRQGRGPIERLFDSVKTEGIRQAFLPIRLAQAVVDIITWHGAYQQAVEESPTLVDMNQLHQDNIQKANDAVERSQGSSRPESLAPFEVGTPIQKSMTQFMNFSNGILNQIFGPRTVLARFGLLMALPMALAFFETLLRAIASGLPEDEDGDGILDDLAWELGKNYLRNVAALLPVGGPLLLSFAQGEGDRLSVSPVGSAARTAMDGITSLFGEEDMDARDTKSIGIFLTLITGGIPVAPVTDRIAYVQAYLEGSIVPTSEYDFVRGLITGRSSEASRR